LPYQKHELASEERMTGVRRSWLELVSPRGEFVYSKPVAVLVNRWTGSMGEPRWTAQTPPLIDTANPAISDGRPRLVEFYFVASSGRKSVWTLVRQLRGPHLSTWA
jgi:hypothetical protein